GSRPGVLGRVRRGVGGFARATGPTLGTGRGGVPVAVRRRPGRRRVRHAVSGARQWRLAHDGQGPFTATHEDIPALNEVFSEAFTERYRRDGMVGVRVPHLNPLIWRYAVDDAAGGALVWRDDQGRIVAFNIAHASGTEGWMGPIAVRPEWQGSGLGK